MEANILRALVAGLPLLFLASGCIYPGPLGGPVQTSKESDRKSPQKTDAPAEVVRATSQPAKPNDELIQGYIAWANTAPRQAPKSLEKSRLPKQRGHDGSDISEVSYEEPSTKEDVRKSAPVDETSAKSLTPPAEDGGADAPGVPELPATPPKVRGVAARGAETATSSHRETATDTEANAPVRAGGGPRSLREYLEQHPVDAPDASFREQLDARLLWVAGGDYERARQPLSLVTAEQEAIARGLIDAWIELRESHMGDLSDAANRAGKRVDEFRESLRRLSDLTVSNLAICQSVRGFAQYDPIEPARFPAGVSTEFVLYCEIRDFVSQKSDNGLYETRFELTTTILTRSGDCVLELKDANIVDHARNRRQDCFIPRLVRLPATLSPGSYVAKVTLTDKLGKKVAESRATFQIVAGE